MADRSTSQDGPSRSRRLSMSDALRMRETFGNDIAQNMMNDLRNLVAEERRLENFANELPKLSESDLATLGQTDNTCPICLNTLLAILAEEEMALAMGSPTHAPEDLGVVRLADTCGHIFCRKDIRNWMREGRRTCPTCRRPFITSAPGNGDGGVQDQPQASDFTRMPNFAWMAREQFGISADGLDELLSPRSPPLRGNDEGGREDGRSEFVGMYS